MSVEETRPASGGKAKKWALGLTKEEAAHRLATLFKVFADPTRIALLEALRSSELRVGDLCAGLGMTQSAVSHQLAILREARIVRTRREGKEIWYALDDDHVERLLSLGLEHVSEGSGPA